MYHYVHFSPLVYIVLLSKYNGKIVPVHAMNAYQGRRGRAPPFLTSEFDWGEWLLDTPVALPMWKGIQYLLNRRVSGPQSHPGCITEKKNLLPLPGIKPQIVQATVSSLYQLH